MSDLLKYAHAVSAILSLSYFLSHAILFLGLKVTVLHNAVWFLNSTRVVSKNVETQHAIFGSRSHSAISRPILQIPTSVVVLTKIMNPRIVQFYLCCCCFFPFKSKYVLHHTLSLCSSFTLKDQISYPCTTAGRLTFVHTLLLVFFRPVHLIVKVTTLWLSPPKRQAGCGVHTASYFMDVRSAFPRYKPARS